MNAEKKVFDLNDRTSNFGVSVIKLCQSLKETTITRPLIQQIVRSATSIGANYREANAASSGKDFKNKIHISKKEAQETQHWLQMLATASPVHKEQLQILWKECQELVLIFGKILSSIKQKN